MNAKRQLSGLKKVDFSKKTDKQTIKYITKKYELLGYAIPNYLKGQKLTKSQLNSAINRITKGLNSIIKKEERSRKTQSKSLDYQYEQTLKKYNKTVEQTLEALKTMGLPQMQIDYLSGKDIFLSYYDKKSFFYDGVPIQKLENIVITDNKTKREMIKKFKQDMKQIQFKNVYKTLTDSSQNDKWFENEFMSSPTIQLSCKPYIQEMIRAEYNTLSPLQRDLWIKEVLRELLDRYPEDSIVGNEEKIEVGVYQAITESLKKYKGLNEMKGVYD